MAQIEFYHPEVVIDEGGEISKEIGNTNTSSVSYQENGNGGSRLYIDIRPNEIYWSYGLHTQSYATYAGEVTQILSAYIDTFSISGDIRTYRDMELIYQWFINYMYIATQGKKSKASGSYSEIPVEFSYPHREWKLQLRPLKMPSLEYGTEVVVPSWTMEASVVEDENMKLTKFNNEVAPKAIEQGLKTLNANFGIGLQNPFAYYTGIESQADVEKFLHNVRPIVNPNGEQLTNWYWELIKNISTGQFKLDELAIPVSKPTKPRKQSQEEIGVGSGAFSTTGGLPNPTEELSVQRTPGTTAKINAKNGVALAPEKAPSAVVQAIAAGNQIHELPYPSPDVHYGSLKKIWPAYDCSGSVSYLLYKAGVLGKTEAMDTEELYYWGQAGEGEWITVYTNPAAGENGHAFIVVAGIMMNTVWPSTWGGESGIPSSPSGGPRWFPGSSIKESLEKDLGGRTLTARHPKGL